MAGPTNRDFDSEVLLRVSEGESLRQVCADLKDFGCPTAGRFCQRVLDDDAFAKRYARAREMQCEAWADKIYLEASTPKLGEKTELDAGGNVVKVTQGDTVDRSRLTVDALKWLLARLHPKRYGDKVEQRVGGLDGGPIQFSWKSRSTTPHETK